MGSLFRNVDASWLRMDDPTNLMVVTGVLVLDAPVPVDRIRATGTGASRTRTPVTTMRLVGSSIRSQDASTLRKRDPMA